MPFWSRLTRSGPRERTRAAPEFIRRLPIMLTVLATALATTPSGFAQDARPPNQPAANQPWATNQPAANQPAAIQPAANQPATNQPATNQPAADQPAANQPAANQPAANQPAKRQAKRQANQPPEIPINPGGALHDGVVKPGVQTSIGMVWDCAQPHQAPHVIASANNGSVVIKKGKGPACGRASMDVTYIFYTSKPGFKGRDSVFIMTFLTGGQMDRNMLLVVK